METPIPITIPLFYDTYSLLFSQGLLGTYLCEIPCPKCSSIPYPQIPSAALELTKSTVYRTAFILEKDDFGIDKVIKCKAKIALTRCSLCKSRYRVLPADFLPFKLYSLPVIELTVSLYNQGDLSLRDVAWYQLYGDRTPEHTTLHAWTEGLGAFCLGRPIGEVATALPANRIMAEFTIRFPSMKSFSSTPVSINRKRYRSEARRQRLKACKRFENVCTIINAKSSFKFSELNRLIVSWGNSYGLGFRTGIRCTPVEHIVSADMLSWRQTSIKEPLSCPIHGRSPPGDSK
jgi:hypothetical protein